MQILPKLLGVLLVVGIVIMTVVTSGVGLGTFVNLTGIVIVLAGTAAALLISYSPSQLKQSVFLVTDVFFRKQIGSEVIGSKLIDFSSKNDIRSVDPDKAKECHPFLKDCIVMIQDGYEEEMVRKVLTQRIHTFWNSESQDVGVLKVIGKYPPAFGMIGTVAGLIALMARIGGESDMSQTGFAMAVALTTTLYGLAITNFMMKPICDNLALKSEENLKTRMMILEVAIAMKNGLSILAIQDTINSFLVASKSIDVLARKDAA